jgi:hypothetical protein
MSIMSVNIELIPINVLYVNSPYKTVTSQKYVL